MLIAVRVGMNGEQRSLEDSSVETHTGVPVVWDMTSAPGQSAASVGNETVVSGEDFPRSLQKHDLGEGGRGVEAVEAVSSRVV